MNSNSNSNSNTLENSDISNPLNIFTKLHSIGTSWKEKFNGLISQSILTETEKNAKNSNDKESSIDSLELYLTTQVSEPFQAYSDSEDSDEEIFLNFSGLERTSDWRASKISRKSIEQESEAEFQNDDVLNGSHESGFGKRHHNKTAIARVLLSLNSDTSTLHISVLQVYDLVRNEAHSRNSISSYGNRKQSIIEAPRQQYYQVHVTLLPEKIHKRKTKKKPGPDPAFNESFTFPNISLESAQSYMLRLRIYMHQNNVSLSTIMGQAIVNLGTIDLSIQSEYNFTMTEASEDQDVSEETLPSIEYEGSSLASTEVESVVSDPELMLGLSYNSKTGRLSVEIVQGISFTTGSAKGKEYYVTLSLFSSIGKELSHTKSSIRKGTSSPIFRESFIFQVALFQLKEVTLMISVFSKKSMHRKEMIGWLAFGFKASGSEEANHWSELRESTDLGQITHNHKLRQNSNKKSILN